MSEKYDPLKGIKRTQAMLMTEEIGYSTAATIAANVPGAGAAVANQAFTLGSSLAGMPSLVSGADNVLKSLDTLYPKKKK